MKEAEKYCKDRKINPKDFCSQNIYGIMQSYAEEYHKELIFINNNQKAEIERLSENEKDLSNINQGLEKERAELRRASNNLCEHYEQLVDCGDCGNWNPREEDVVIELKKALSQTKEEN